MSTVAGWKAQIALKLSERDKIEKQDSGIFHSLNYLNIRLNELESKLQILETTEEKKDIAKLLNDADITQQTLSEREIELKEKNIENEFLTAKVTELEKNVTLLKDGYTNIQNKLNRLQEETTIKNENLETVNDNLLSLQIENNLLNSKLSSLTKENESLVKRWMDRIEKDVAVLNDANEIVEQYKRSNTPNE